MDQRSSERFVGQAGLLYGPWLGHKSYPTVNCGLLYSRTVQQPLGISVDAERKERKCSLPRAPL